MVSIRELNFISMFTNVPLCLPAPSAPPQNVRATSVSSSAVTITWSPPDVDSQNGVIRGYIVYVQEIETQTITAYNTTTTSLALSSLHPYYQYQFYVGAVTVENGPFGYATVQTEQDGKNMRRHPL